MMLKRILVRTYFEEGVSAIGVHLDLCGYHSGRRSGVAWWAGVLHQWGRKDNRREYTELYSATDTVPPVKWVEEMVIRMKWEMGDWTRISTMDHWRLRIVSKSTISVSQENSLTKCIRSRARLKQRSTPCPCTDAKYLDRIKSITAWSCNGHDAVLTFHSKLNLVWRFAMHSWTTKQNEMTGSKHS